MKVESDASMPANVPDINVLQVRIIPIAQLKFFIFPLTMIDKNWPAQDLSKILKNDRPISSDKS